MKKILLIILLTKLIFGMNTLTDLLRSYYNEQDRAKRQAEINYNRILKERQRIEKAKQKQSNKSDDNALTKAMNKKNDIYSVLANNYKNYIDNQKESMSGKEQLDYEDEQKEFNKNLAIQGYQK